MARWSRRLLTVVIVAVVALHAVGTVASALPFEIRFSSERVELVSAGARIALSL